MIFPEGAFGNNFQNDVTHHFTLNRTEAMATFVTLYPCCLSNLVIFFMDIDIDIK